MKLNSHKNELETFTVLRTLCSANALMWTTVPATLKGKCASFLSFCI